MDDIQKLTDILMDELPEDHPWQGEIRKLRDRLIAKGVTVRERGRWVGQRCSICDESYMDYADADSYPAIGEPKPHFCPNCGADMRGEEDG